MLFLRLCRWKRSKTKGRQSWYRKRKRKNRWQRKRKKNTKTLRLPTLFKGITGEWLGWLLGRLVDWLLVCWLTGIFLFFSFSQALHYRAFIMHASIPYTTCIYICIRSLIHTSCMTLSLYSENCLFFLSVFIVVDGYT